MSDNEITHADAYAQAVQNMDALAKKTDAYYSEATGIGTADYDRLKTLRQRRESQIADDELETYYIDSDLAATTVDRLVEDALRQGYEVEFDEDNPDLQEEIVSWAEKKYKVIAELSQARKWARLFGGSGVFYGADNQELLSEPLEPGAQINYLRAYGRSDMDTALWYDRDEDFITGKYGKPSVYRVTTNGGHSTHTATIHESRFAICMGLITTRRRYMERNGWGDSVLNRVLEVLKRFDGAWLATMQLLTDSSVPVYYVKELMSLLESGNLDALITRMRAIDQQKSNLKAIVMDAEGEKYERVAAQLTDVAQVLQIGMIRIASAAQMPVSVLFGQAPSGLNANQEADTRNWYDRVNYERVHHLGPELEAILIMLLSQPDSPTKGRIPEGFKVVFPSIWQSDPVQQATIYQMNATADGIYMANQALSPEEVTIHRSAAANGAFGFPPVDTKSRQDIMKATKDPRDLFREPIDPMADPTPKSKDETKAPSNSVSKKK